MGNTTQGAHSSSEVEWGITRMETVGGTKLFTASTPWEKQMKAVQECSLTSIEPFNDRLNRYLGALTISTDQKKAMVAAFVNELEVGLECHLRHPHDYIPQECSFKMLDACISELPTGKEKGIFYALDFGGTNFRAVRVELDGKGGLQVSQKQKSLMSAKLANAAETPRVLMDARAGALQMFDFFAQTCLEFIRESGDMKKGDNSPTMECGFTFSFPCAQRRINSAVLIGWTKGFETGRKTDDPVESLDVCELMNVAFTRNNVPLICNSVLNDTVGTLLDCAYEMDHSKPPCLIGLILGTGMNACYFEPAAPRYGYQGRVINIECGNFNRSLPRMNVDCELDFWSVANRGQQQLEKMVSGAYLGEIARTIIVRVFQHRVPAIAWQKESFDTSCLSQVMNDGTPALTITEKTMFDTWGVRPDEADRRAINQICVAVADRSAALSAVVIAGCAIKTGRLQAAMGGLSVGIDGSLYKKNPWYQERVRHHLDDVLGATKSKLIALLLADDGSGKGAGVLAATLNRNNK